MTKHYLHSNNATDFPKCILWMLLSDGGPHLMRKHKVTRLASGLLGFLTENKNELATHGPTENAFS